MTSNLIKLTFSQFIETSILTFIIIIVVLLDYYCCNPIDWTLITEPAKYTFDELIGKTTCPYTIYDNMQENREPPLIREIKCDYNATCDDCPYQCLQVYQTVNVFYLNTNTPEELDIDIACVCSQKPAHKLTNIELNLINR